MNLTSPIPRGAAPLGLSESALHMTGEFDHSRFSALVFVVAIGVAPLTAIPLRAASADIATCDRLAAFPDDKDKPADVKGSYDIAKRDFPGARNACKVVAGGPRVP